MGAVALERVGDPVEGLLGVLWMGLASDLANA